MDTVTFGISRLTFSLTTHFNIIKDLTSIRDETF